MNSAFSRSPPTRPGVSDADLYAKLLDSCAFHRDLGYGTAWFIEHHFSDYYPCPSPTSRWRTSRPRSPTCRSAPACSSTPWYEPLRLAGELAMLSNMTEQKLYIGLGRGTAKYEYDAFGVDMTQARELFAEPWRVLDLAMSGERSRYDGEHVHVTSRCASAPPRCGSGSTSSARSARPSSTKVMAELGLAPMCTSFGALTPELLPAWEAAATERRHAATRAARLRPLLVNMIVADTDEDAIDEAQTYMTRFMEAQVVHYGAHPRRHRRASAATRRGPRPSRAGSGSATPTTSRSGRRRRSSARPDTCARRVQEFADAGFDHIILHTVTPGAPREAQHRQ